MFDEIGVYDGVEEMIVHRVVDMRILIIVAPSRDTEQSSVGLDSDGKTNHRVR